MKCPVLKDNKKDTGTLYQSPGSVHVGNVFQVPFIAAKGLNILLRLYESLRVACKTAASLYPHLFG
jgi:hypothetical protein